MICYCVVISIPVANKFELLFLISLGFSLCLVVSYDSVFVHFYIYLVLLSLNVYWFQTSHSFDYWIQSFLK